jgi:signal transduction histidine kinase
LERRFDAPTTATREALHKVSPALAPCERMQRTERIIAYIRAVVVAFSAVTYLAFMPSKEHAAVAYAVLIAALLYSAVAIFLEPRTIEKSSATAVINTIVDLGLILGWIWATGGAESPYYVLLFAEAAAMAGRFGLRIGILGAIGSVGVYVGLVVADGGLPAVVLLPRIGSVFAIVVFVAYVAEVSAHSERHAVESEARAQSLEELDRLRIAFITNMSHELRTPLTAVLGASATLSHRRDSLDEEDVATLIDMVERQSRRLGFLVNDLIESLEENAVVLPEPSVDRVPGK